MNNKPNWWSQNLNALVTLIAGIVIPAAIFLAGYIYSESAVKIATNQKYIEIAISIFRDSSGKMKPLRKWATNIIDTCAPVKLDSAARKALEEGSNSFPFWNRAGVICNDGYTWAPTYKDCPDNYK